MRFAKRIGEALIAFLFWIAVWHFAAIGVGKPLLLPSPVTVGKRMAELLATADFYRITAVSVRNVLLGFCIAVCCGTVLSLATSHGSFLRTLIFPVMTVIKATPVASFIILAMIWIGSARVPVFITFLIVLPIVWSDLDTGFSKVDPMLLQVASVYRFSFWKRMRIVVIPSVKPYFFSAMRTSVGLAWKAGIAAEIIAMPKSSIGTEIGEAKLYIDTPTMFAWTAIVILLSLLIEIIVTALFQKRKVTRTQGGTAT